MPEIVPLDARGPSVRGVFRVARLVVGWAVGLAAFWAAIWIILSVGGVR